MQQHFILVKIHTPTHKEKRLTVVEQYIFIILFYLYF